jgi:hypothetical protein
MVYARTAHNRTVYASPPVGGSGSGTLYDTVAKICKKLWLLYRRFDSKIMK